MTTPLSASEDSLKVEESLSFHGHSFSPTGCFNGNKRELLFYSGLLRYKVNDLHPCGFSIPSRTVRNPTVNIRRSHVIPIKCVLVIVLIGLCFSALIYFAVKNSIEISFDVIEVHFIITAQPAPLTQNKQQLTEDGWMDITSLFSCHQNELVLSISEFSDLLSVETVGSLLWVTFYSYILLSQYLIFNFFHLTTFSLIWGLIGKVTHWL